MVTISTFRKTALALPGVTEQPHFEKPSFRVAKKIFATLDIKNKIACIKLPAAEQDVFSVFDKTIIYPVPNKWGSQGWTTGTLSKLTTADLRAALEMAWHHAQGKPKGKARAKTASTSRSSPEI